MHSLEKIKARAQADANRERRAVVILNLNQFSPQYVMREDCPENRASKRFVALVEPQ